MPSEISVQKRGSSDKERRNSRRNDSKSKPERAESRNASGVEPRKVSDSIQQLDPAAMRLVRDSYNLLDSDGSGAVSRQALQDMMVSLGRRPNGKVIDDMLKRCGAEADGQFGFANYLVMMSEIIKELPTNEDLESYFTAFETNGRIDSAELRKELRTQGVTDEQIDLVFKKFEKQKGVSRSFDSKSFVSLMGV